MLDATFVAAFVCNDAVFSSPSKGACSAQFKFAFAGLLCIAMHVFLDFLSSAMTSFKVLAALENRFTVRPTDATRVQGKH